MKKTMRYICVVCALSLFITSSCFSVSASGYDESGIIIDDPHNYLGSFEQSNSTRLIGVEYHLFTMTASAVDGLLTTKQSGKYFYGSDIPSGSVLYYVGQLSTYNQSSASAGICYQRSTSGEFVAVHRTTFPSDEFTGSANIAASSLTSSTRYFGFINGTGTGETSGSVQFWYLDLDG